MFTGTQRTGIQGITDAVPRERWVLAAIVFFIVAAGMMPNLAVALRANAAHEISLAR
jgi:NADH:ubiquinone oxidoreductase subunit 4 (subunit M)